MRGLTPGQVLIKIVHEELVRTRGEANAELNLRTPPPAVVLMAGLQGSGKTTSVAKLARWLKERQKKKVMVVSCDVYRPAAIAQLRKLAGEVGAEFFPSEVGQLPETIARQALEHARRHGFEAVSYTHLLLAESYSIMIQVDTRLQMVMIIALALSAFAITAYLSLRLASVTAALRLLDHPNARSLHQQPVPRLSLIHI